MKKIICFLFPLIFIAACSGSQASGPSPTIEAVKITSTYPVSPPPTGTPTMTPTNPFSQNPGKPIIFTTTDGITLAGTLFGEGTTAVILAHQGSFDADQTTWYPFASLLAEHGFTALTFDFRGIGKSGGKLGYRNLVLDVDAAAQFLEDRGFQHIICVGASMGGTACALAAQDHVFDGLVIFASTMTAGSASDTLHISPANLELLTPPKFFISASSDSSIVVNDTKQMYELSPEPKSLLFLTGTQHGTNLFDTSVGEELSAALLRFLEYVDNQAFDVLPTLQPITTQTAGKIQLLRTMEIPGYTKGRISQCSVAFSPDGSRLIGACGKNQVPIWDVQNGFLLRTLYNGPVQAVACAFSPGGEQIACGGFDNTITRWYAVTGGEINDFEENANPIWDLAFDPSGTYLASCTLGLFGNGPGQGKVQLWNLSNGEPTWEYSGTRDYLSVSFDPSGEMLAYGSIGGNVGILDAATGELLRELTDSSHNIGDVAYSPTGQWLAAGSDDDQIYIWDTVNYELAAQLTGHTGYVNGVAFNPDGTLLISGSHDKTIGVWDLGKRKLITQLKGHEREILRVTFSPDGTLIASISWDGTVRLWGVSNE